MDEFVHFPVGKLEPLMKNYLDTCPQEYDCEILLNAR